MSNQGGGGDPARGSGPGRGRGGGLNGAPGRGGGFAGAGNGAGFNGPPPNNGGRGGGFVGVGNGAGFNGPPPNNGGRGGGGYSNRFYGGGNNRQNNFVAGESSRAAENCDGQGQSFPMEFGNDFGQFNRGSNYSNYNRNGGNYQHRARNYGSNNFNGGNRNYNGGRVNFNQFRNNGVGNNGPVNPFDSNLAGISPDLLKEAMQGVLAALAAAAQKGGGEGGTYKPKVDNVKLVKLTVEGDPMSIPEIAECLRRIVPVENFQWEIYNFQNNVFRVKFPNKAEAQRMKAFRTYPIPDRASDLVFEEWSALEDPFYMLPEVWLRVKGIPADDGFEEFGRNNGEDDDNGANGYNGEDANDMEIEKTGNNETQNNGNKRNGNVQQGNNGKGVVSHQAQEKVEAPTLFGSINNVLLSKDLDSTGTDSQMDAAPGLVKSQAESALGSERSGLADAPLLLGSRSTHGAMHVAEPAPGSLSTSPHAPLSPRSPAQAQQSRLLETASAPLASMASAGACLAYATRDRVLVPCPLSPLPHTTVGLAATAGLSRPLLSAQTRLAGAAAGQSAMLQAQPHVTLMASLATTLAGPTAAAPLSLCMQMDRPLDASAFGFSAPNESVITHTPSTKKTAFVKTIMDKHPELAGQAADMYSCTPVRQAVQHGKVDMLRVMLEHNSTLGYEINSRGCPLLTDAAYQGQVAAVREILKHCPDAPPYNNTNGQTLLHVAVRYDHAELVEFVLKTPLLRKLVNVQDKIGKTALHYAVQKCNPRIVIALLTHEDIDATVLDNGGISTTWELSSVVKNAKTLNWNEVIMLMSKANPQDVLGLRNLHWQAKRETTDASRKDAKSLTQMYTSNTSLVAILIATITFAAPFTLPGGYSNNAGSEGLPIMSNKFAFHVFLISDTLAMCSSFTVAFICIIARWEDYEFLIYYRSFTKKLMWFAYVATTTAFSTGLYTVLAPRL
ncbi:hypothetical protein ACQ4PT_037883 [Festuca glaucescens]